MTLVQALQLLPLLLLLPLPLLLSSPCPSTMKEMVVTTTSDAKTLAEALLCDGPANFTVSWHGDVTLSHTLSVSNGSTLNVAGSPGNKDSDTGAVVTSDGTSLLFEVDHRSTVSLTGLTLYGGDGALRVNGDSFVEAADCAFKNNNRTSSDLGGAIFVSGSNVVLKGDTVFANNTADYGGAIYMTESSELSVTEGGSFFFVNNHAAVYGGAVRLYNQSVFNSYGTASFASNEAEYGGGAVHANRGSNVHFCCETIFYSNTASHGGAINCFSSEINFTGNVSFEGNKAGASGGAVYVDDYSNASLGGDIVFTNNTATYGGAIYSDDSSEVNVPEGGNISFFNNHAASGSGGAIGLFSQGVFSSYGTTSFISNKAKFGGAIAAIDGSIIYVDGVTSFVGNEATVDGGAINSQGSEVNFIDFVSFESNHALEGGGAVHANRGSNVYFCCETVFYNNTASHGGAMGFFSSEINFTGNVSFEGNNASASGAVYIDDYSNASLGGEIVFSNNTATYGGAIYSDDSSEVNVPEGGNISFFNNHAASGSGGAIGLFSQGVFSSYGTTSFVSNKAIFGGAITSQGSEVNFLDFVSFDGNHALEGGGAVHANGGSNVYFCCETVFYNNTASHGGAINFFSSEINFIGNISFEGNNASASGGAVYVDDYSNASLGGEIIFTNNTATYGGAIYSDDSSEVNVTEGGNIYFFNNHAASGSGGAIGLFSHGVFSSYGTASFVSNDAKFGGAIAAIDGSIIYVDGVTSFVGNEATDNGGAIYAVDSYVFVGMGSLFMFNVASIGSGGGVYASRSVNILIGTTFAENHCAWGGGGIAFFSSGSLLENGGSNPSYTVGCSFDGNTATDGGAIYTAAGYDVIMGSSFTTNFAVVQGGALLHSGTLVAITECTFESNMAGEDGLAVMSLGLIDYMANLTFLNNSFFCASGKYGLEKSSDEVEVEEDPDTCRWGVVCSRCIDQCDAPAGIDMDNTTVPVCEVVPKGVNTSRNSGMTLETLNLLSGFYRTSSQSREILKCYREEACMGGSNAGRYCAEAYAGPYCATCDEGYGSGFQYYSCHSCQGSDKWAAIGGAVAVLVVVIFVVALSVAYLVGVVDRPFSERGGRWERRVSNFRDGLVHAIPLTAIKIVLVSWQIITQFSGVVKVQYPLVYENFLAVLSVVNLNLGSILSLSCVVETNFYVRLVLATIAPVAVLGVLAITYRVAMVRNGHSIHAMRVARSKHLSMGLFLLFVVYSSVSYTIFQTFVCDSLDNGVTYLRADYDLVCWTKTHVGYMTYAGFMVFVYPVGVPAVFAWALFRNKSDITAVAGTTIGSWVPPEAEAIKDLWVPYKRSRYYYEVIECGRRIALTGLAVFIYPGSTAQVAIEALLAIVFSSISEILSPFAKSFDAWLYRSGTWVVFLSMYLALLLKVEAADENSHSQDVFAGVLIAAHVGMVLVVIANALMFALKGFREVRAIEMPVVIQGPSTKSVSGTTRWNKTEILEEDHNDASKDDST